MFGPVDGRPTLDNLPIPARIVLQAGLARLAGGRWLGKVGKRLMRLNLFGVTLAAVLGGVAAAASDTIPGIQAHLRLVSQHVPINHPVWVQFSIENTTHEPVTLTVPGTEPAIPSPEMGLPLVHVFSGGSSSGVMVTTESGRHWDQPVGYRTPAQAPILLLAPRSAVGTTLDLREYFPSLRGAGQFRLAWKPYAGGVTSETVLLTIAPRKQVEVVTDDGTLTVSLFYDDAPQHVANFLELAKSGHAVIVGSFDLFRIAD